MKTLNIIIFAAVASFFAGCNAKQNKPSDNAGDSIMKNDSDTVKVAENAKKLSAKEVFLLLPDSLATPMDLTVNKREKVLKGESIKDSFYGDEGLTLKVESANSGTYLTLSGPWESTWEMRVWTKDDGTQMAIVNEVECGPECVQTYCISYDIDKSGKALKETKFSPRKVQSLKARDFLGGALSATQIKDIESEMADHLYYRLPRKGDDISVILDETWLGGNELPTESFTITR